MRKWRVKWSRTFSSTLWSPSFASMLSWSSQISWFLSLFWTCLASMSTSCTGESLLFNISCSDEPKLRRQRPERWRRTRFMTPQWYPRPLFSLQTLLDQTSRSTKSVLQRSLVQIALSLFQLIRKSVSQDHYFLRLRFGQGSRQEKSIPERMKQNTDESWLTSHRLTLCLAESDL